ncbi:MAG: PepSY-like domain-containing protein [Tannerellaceae bacterium]
MKTKLLSLLSIALIAFFAASCSNDDDNNSIDVPNAVLTAFNNEYPTVVSPTWEYEDPYYVAEFKYNENETEVWYNTAGTMLLTVEDLQSSQLPQAIKTNIASSIYSAWTYDDVNLIQRDGFSSIYRVELDDPKSDGEVTLYYTASGVLIKEVPDIDNTPLKPVVIPQKIMDQLNQTFPSSIYSILDFDMDSTTKNYEVDLFGGNRAIEVVFDPQQNLLYWEWEISYKDVPTVVQDAFLAAGYTVAQIDDIYFRETPNADPRENITTYIVELEVNGKDMVVIFNENGKQLQ